MKRAAFPLIVTLLHSAPALAQCDAGLSDNDIGVLRDTFPADLGTDGIRVNAICPGVTDTPMVAGVAQIPGLLDAVLAPVPMQIMMSCDS